MQVQATLSKTTDGRQSTWRFVQDDDGACFALRVAPAMKLISCKDMDDMRKLYRTYRDKYGFAKV